MAAETPSAEAKPKSEKEIESKPEATSQGDESKPVAEANKTEKKSSQMSLKIQKEH